jgi:hypothetical protein
MRILSAGWSSLAARRAHNPKVVGSNPTPATKVLERPHWGLFYRRWKVFAGVIQKLAV